MKPFLIKRRGFTLIELMVAVAIIGIIAGIAVPKYLDIVQKSQEGSTKGNLGAIRSALVLYYSENDSEYPRDNLNSMFFGGHHYMPEIPAMQVISAQHPISRSVTAESAPTDIATWSYNNNDTTIFWGRPSVGCTHLDLRGQIWSSY